MSWSGEIREELCRRPVPTPEAAAALLTGLLRQGSTVDLQGRGRLVTLPSQSPAVARLAFQLLAELSPERPELLLGSAASRPRRTPRFEFRFRDPGRAQALLAGLGVGAVALSKGALAGATRRRFFLRGLFLACGSVSEPSRPPHLELTFPNALLAEEARAVMARRGFRPTLERRRGLVRVYLKSRAKIARFLEDVDAPKALFVFADAWAIREVRDGVNRKVNAETANLVKSVDAGLRQERALRRIQAAGRLERLSEPLAEIASARLKDPEASLSDLGQKLGLTKSGANHRMRRLMALDPLRGRDGTGQRGDKARPTVPRACLERNRVEI